MLFHFVLGVMSVLAAIFFVGLAGCGIAIVLSWIDIVRDGLRKDADPGLNPSN